jgi:hypothetical protein
MDTTTRNLLVELARTVLRVLEPSAVQPLAGLPDPHPTPWATAVNPLADRGTPPVNSQAAVLDKLDKAAKRVVERGAVVRVWSGHRYECGVVTTISRDRANCTVRIDRGEGKRGKLVLAPIGKVEVLTNARA